LGREGKTEEEEEEGKGRGKGGRRGGEKRGKEGKEEGKGRRKGGMVEEGWVMGEGRRMIPGILVAGDRRSCAYKASKTF